MTKLTSKKPNSPDDVSSDSNWLSADSGQFDEFVSLVSAETNESDYPHASSIKQRVPIYQRSDVLRASTDSKLRADLMSEWARVLQLGPGIMVIEGALADRLPVVDRATQIFNQIIEQQKNTGQDSGDHFAKAGANDRIWNALEKHCLSDPENFARYFGAIPISLACEAWLGPGYQLTAQVNQVNPGGKAQVAHRDYHLGFMSPSQMLTYPTHVHQLSPLLTLQAAIAHVDMPLETGPTLYLPYSQSFKEGYVAFQRPEFQAYFNEHKAQLSLLKGDAVFFNPALMHAAGENKTKDRLRLANLIQASSVFGVAMENVNRLKMIEALYPHLLESQENKSLTAAEIDSAVAAAAASYAFPTNLDRDPPMNGLAPLSQATRVREALTARLAPMELMAELSHQDSNRRSAD